MPGAIPVGASPLQDPPPRRTAGVLTHRRPVGGTSVPKLLPFGESFGTEVPPTKGGGSIVAAGAVGLALEALVQPEVLPGPAADDAFERGHDAGGVGGGVAGWKVV